MAMMDGKQFWTEATEGKLLMNITENISKQGFWVNIIKGAYYIHTDRPCLSYGAFLASVWQTTVTVPPNAYLLGNKPHCVQTSYLLSNLC